MQSSPLPIKVPLVERDAAYTTTRQDVVGMVPAAARDILDVGCSNGALGRSLLAMKLGRRVCGIEGDGAFVEDAARYLQQVVHADLNCFEWNSALAGQFFDCIIFADVLEHLLDPQRCLQQAREHLAPGGSIVISLPNIRHLSALTAIYFGGCFPRRERGIFDSTHLRWFTLADARALLTSSGLTVSAMGLALRWGDRGGGRMNRLLNRLPLAVCHWTPVREFLTYQVCLRAELPAWSAA